MMKKLWALKKANNFRAIANQGIEKTVLLTLHQADHQVIASIIVFTIG